MAQVEITPDRTSHTPLRTDDDAPMRHDAAPVVGAAVADAAGPEPIKATQLIGYPVVSRSNGEAIGHVQDVIYDPYQGRLVGFRLGKEGWFGPHRVLAFSDVISIGADAMMIDAPDKVAKENGGTAVERAAEGGASVIGKRLLTERGDYLGSVHDILLNRETGQVAGYEVSGGIYEDVMKGRHLIRAMQIRRIGEDFVMVPDEVKAHIESDMGGLTAAWEATREKAAETWDATRDQAAETWAATKEKAGELRHSSAQAIEDREARFALGKTAGQDVNTAAGELLVGQGQLIDTSVIERARAAGAMHSVAAAAVQSGVQKVQEKAATTWESAKDRAAELQEGAELAVEDREAQFVLDKVAGNDVRTAGGELIVARGQLIDLSIIQRARAAGAMHELTAAAGMAAVRKGVETVRETATRTAERVQAKTAQAGAAAEEGGVAYVLGKVAGRTVIADTGRVTVSEGEVITAVHVERAQQSGQVAALVAAAALGQLETGFATARDRTSEAVTGATASMVDAIDATREWVADAQGSDIVGRVVSREIRDDAGNLILAAGETVTEAHVSAALEAGKIHLLELAAGPDQTSSIPRPTPKP